MTLRVIAIAGLVFIGSCAYPPPYEPTGPVLSYEEHMRLASVYERRGETGLALREYKKAAMAEAGRAHPHFAMGNIYLAGGYYLEAEDSFLKAIELEPEVGVFYNNLGWLYLQTGRPIQADAIVRRGLVNDPRRSYIYFDTLGVVETVLGSFAEAELLLNEALASIPHTDTVGLFHIYTHLHELYLITGEEDKADEAKRRIRELGLIAPPFPYPWIIR